jgi:DNA invertase Pin-like site-specific DNA recombinase
MAKIGYARVSTRGQKDDSQVDDLTAYGCDKIFIDTASGKLAARPELDNALAYLREGDVFVITRLSRAMRSLKHLLALADELRERGAGLVVLKQQIDTTTPTGRLVYMGLEILAGCRKAAQPDMGKDKLSEAGLTVEAIPA